MECLGQILSSIITIQYHFAYISDIAIISFEYSQRWEIWSINNQYHSYSSLSAHSIQQYHHHHQELQKQNGPYPISIMLREGRLVTLNDMLPLPTHPWITICLTELVMSCIWSILDIQNTERCWDSKCLEGKTTLFIVTTYSRASSIVHHTDQSYLYNSILLYYQMVLSSEFHLK